MTHATILRRSLIAGAIALALPAAWALASDRAATGAVPAMSAAQALAKIEAAGYRSVARLEWERGTWEARALDAEGRRVKLRVDERDGAVTRDERRRGRAG
ncbi:MAG: PepSY domain-containing protein [Alphaproteobacteria bacterium]|nr:PepSY domain-containing protein [Alphaproteobacteria bacterium]